MSKLLATFCCCTGLALAVQAQPIARRALPTSTVLAGQPAGGTPAAAGGVTPTVNRGAWSPVFPWGPVGTPFVAIHSHVLPTGKVLSWANGGNPTLWNPNPAPGTPAFAALPVVPGGCNIFCSGHSFLPNGKLLIAGGHAGKYCSRTNQDEFVGMPNGNIFDFSANSWQQIDTMNQGRWYPTSTTLLNGKVLVTSGALDGCSNRNNSTPDLWQNTPKWHRLTTAVRVLPLYPMMFAAPNGQVFNAGPNVDTGYLNTTGTGGWTMTGTTTLGASLATTGGSDNGTRTAGTAVMYRPGRILVAGGSGRYGPVDPATNRRDGGVTATTEIIELAASGAVSIRSGPPMAYPRYHVNSTVLPDGTVLVTGGTTNWLSDADAFGVLPAELWTPPTVGYPDGRWTTMAALTIPRLYHSTAVLLPDGRVLAAGGGEGGNFAAHRDAQLFSPPYLTTDPISVGPPRLTVTAAPAAVGYGQAFAVGTPDPAAVARVTLVRLNSVTHSFDQNQRFLELAFSNPGTGALTVVAPPNTDCPPGPYWVFLLDAQGLPSVGRLIYVDVNACPPDVSFTETTVSQGKCRATIRLTASGSNLGSNPRWFVDGALQAVPAGQLFVDVQLGENRQSANYALEATPPCGGGAATVTGTLTRRINPCVPSTP